MSEHNNFPYKHIDEYRSKGKALAKTVHRALDCKALSSLEILELQHITRQINDLSGTLKKKIDMANTAYLHKEFQNYEALNHSFCLNSMYITNALNELEDKHKVSIKLTPIVTIRLTDNVCAGRFEVIREGKYIASLTATHALMADEIWGDIDLKYTNDDPPSLVVDAIERAISRDKELGAKAEALDSLIYTK